MIEDDTTSSPPAPTEPGGRRHGKFTLALVLILGIAAGVALVLVIESWQRSDDDKNVLVPVTTSAPQAAATTSVPAVETAPPITPSPPAPDADDPLQGAVWPVPDSGTRYTDPVEAARSFAVDFVGFTDPVLGEFLVADSRSGEVEVQPSDNGPTTIVFLRKLGDDDNWWVLGSVSQNVVVQSPRVRDIIDSPLTMAGQSRSFEGNVQVELRADGVAEPLVAGFVTGGAGEEFGPFEGSF